MMNNNIINSYSYLFRMHLISGVCCIPLPFEVKAGTKDEARFAKTELSARGSVGILTYDLVIDEGSIPPEKMAVMFSVPFDYSLYSNWYAVGVFSSTQKCDNELFKLMYNDNQSGFVRGTAKDGHILHTHGEVVIQAAMSDNHNSILRVRVKQIDKSQVGELNINKISGI